MSRKIVMLICFSLIVLLSGCAALPFGQPKGVKETLFIMDTIIEMTAYGPQAQAAMDNAFAEIKRIDSLMNIYDKNSEVSQINTMAGQGPVAVSDDMLFVLEKSLYYSELTHGAFDVTIGPLTTLWGIGKKGEYVPSQDEIKNALAVVDYRKMVVDKKAGTVMLKQKGMMLDLGAVAKGYAVDQAIEVLKKYDIKSALINAGGDIRVIGTKPDGNPWRIGVQHPRNSEGLAAKIPLTGWDTLVTSGDYQRFFEKDGIRYHHILHAKTGKPAMGTTSATIASDNSLDGDILSTVLFILGPETGMEILRQIPNIEALWITQDGKTHISPGLAGKIELVTAGR